jgi:iron complex outermembrane receptor protein
MKPARRGTPFEALAIACRAAVMTALLAAGPAQGQAQLASLADLSLEQLRDIVVRTVSRFDEPLDRAAASVYVITADDIRRSGATTIPEALRLAPTLDVARADANQYAISARGFDNVLANKMLVLIDGRTVYTPLFSGVFWEAQDVLLEDVERIEVVSGPSTALWGSNAVDGLIHVITRSAKATQGAAVALDAGNRQRGAAARYGMEIGADGHVRLYAKSYDRSDTHRADGSSVVDRADGAQVGFRADWLRRDSVVTVQGDAYRGTIDQLTAARTFSGGNLLARWETRLAQGGDLTVQGYLDRTRRDHPQTFAETLDTADVVAEVARTLDRHRVLVGAGYRHADDQLTQFAALAFQPGSRRLTWTRVFAQDQLTLSPRLKFTAALSIERNPFTGTEPLPSVRLAWEPREGRLAWAALSRAVRAPSRVDRELFQPAQPPFLLAGGPDFRSEIADVLELGYRAQANPAWQYSLTLFHHEHSRLRSLAPTPAGLQFRNDIEGHTDGLEAWTRWRASPRWRIDAGLVLMNRKLAVRPGGVDLGGQAALGNDPRHWASLRSAFDVSPRITWDVSVRRVGARPLPDVPAYTAIDTRLAWHVTHDAEVALVLQNVADARHAEWGVATNRVELERSALLQMRWRF